MKEEKERKENKKGRPWVRDQNLSYFGREDLVFYSKVINLA